jgi:hypothetical protein
VTGDGHVPVSAHRQARAVRPLAPCSPKLRSKTDHRVAGGWQIASGSRSSRSTSSTESYDTPLADLEFGLRCAFLRALQDGGGWLDLGSARLDDGVALMPCGHVPGWAGVDGLFLVGELQLARELVDVLLYLAGVLGYPCELIGHAGIDLGRRQVGQPGSGSQPGNTISYSIAGIAPADGSLAGPSA